MNRIVNKKIIGRTCKERVNPSHETLKKTYGARHTGLISLKIGRGEVVTDLETDRDG
jgi:hypothetical protein